MPQQYSMNIKQDVCLLLLTVLILETITRLTRKKTLSSVLNAILDIHGIGKRSTLNVISVKVFIKIVMLV
jgi:hypothetical protein